MLYLIEDRDFLKIGYTANLESRMKTYKTHNPHVVLLSSKDGNRVDEKKLHSLCKEYLYDTEWFYNNDKVKEIFKTYQTVAWDNWKTITCGLNQMLLNFKSELDSDKFWSLHPKDYTWDYNFKETCTRLFKDVKYMNKPDNYDYFYNVFKSLNSIMSDFFHKIKTTPLDIINMLSKQNLLSNEEYNFYLNKYNNWCIQKVENELNDVNNQIEVYEKALDQYKKIKLKLEQTYLQLNTKEGV